MRATLWLSVLVLAAAPAALAQRSARYDVYSTGIRIAEVVTGPSYSIRKLDPRTNQWGRPVLAPAAKVAADTAFALWGSGRDLLGRLAAFDRVNWGALDLVGWPTKARIYERDREVRASVNGRTTTATHWVERDASRPLDLLIGAGNQLVAALDPSGDYVIVRRGYEAFTVVSRWQDAAKVSQPQYGYRSLGKLMVPMRDGVRLATLVYLPDGPGATGPFPVVFVRTPYGISSAIARGFQYPARGYALVYQATRGTAYTDPEFRSEGEWHDVINEPNDGADAVDWLVKQSWSNGTICMQGGSFVGYTQWAAAMAKNPALKCLIPESSMGTVFSDQPYMGGTFVEGMAFYMFFMLDEKLQPGRTWNEVLHHRPLIDIDRFALGKEVPQWNIMLDNLTNNDYWKRQDWYRGTHPREFSTLQISGWWDDDFPGTESNWALMDRYGRGAQRLLIGPWKHGYNADRMLNGYRFGPTAVRDDIGLQKQMWYDHILKGMANGADQPRATYFVLGSNEWRTATAWPPAEATATKWYLHSDGQAARLPTVGRLLARPPQGDQTADRYQYDPANPPPNWMSFDQMLRWEDVQSFPYDMKDIEARPDVVVFTSDPLAEDLTIAGELTAVLFASTDVKDTDWWVHVSDLDPRGASHRITQGVIRARFRGNDDPQHHIFGSNFEKEVLLSGDPNEVVRYEFGIRSIANTFEKGHRIRIAVMNAVDNYSFPNSNTGGHEGRTTETVVGRMAIHHSDRYPSHIVLPVMPR
jgi:putative CocE/NonD family hydrolase